MKIFDFFKKKEEQIPKKNITQEEKKELSKEDILKIEDDEALLNIIKGENGYSITECAVKQLKNQKLLRDYIKGLNNYGDRPIKEAIYPGLRDQELLCELIQIEKDYQLQKILADHITDNEEIKKILLNKEDKCNCKSILISKLNEKDYEEILQATQDEEIIAYILKFGKDDKIKSNYLLNHKYIGRNLVSYIEDYNELFKLYHETKDETLKEDVSRAIGIFTCKKCGKENIPKSKEENNCTCKYCKEENHEWEHIDTVTDYRDYSAGARYDRCTRCKLKKNEQIINTL